MMHQGVEIDFVVTDSQLALAFYQSIFEVDVIEATEFKPGNNEAVFSIYGSRFHILDENPAFQLFAPTEGSKQSFWFNIIVPDIQTTYENAIDVGAIEIQPVKKIEAMGISNAMFLDKFGYVWMLHQVHREVSFEERVDILSEDFE